jgi:hypothetical protein
MGLQFFDHGSHVTARNVPEVGRVEKIPPSVYRINVTEEGLDLVRDRKRFTLPSKIYGDHHFHLSAIMEAFEERACSTGVLLKGLKGSGKSLLAEHIGNKCLDLEMPVLLINTEIPAGLLKSVISLIGSCMVYFDEYGKIYGKAAKDSMLALFSDTDLKNVMFVVTANEDKELNEYMIDRPGRFMFRINYGDLTTEVVKDVCRSNDINEEITEYLVAYAAFHHLSFDILMYLVRQAQRVTTAKELNKRISILNVPDPINQSLSVVDVSFQGQHFVGEVIERYDQDHLEIDLIQDGTLEMIGSYVFDRNHPGASVLHANNTGVKYRVKFNDEVIMTIMRQWSQNAGGTGQRKRKAKVKEDGKATLESE